jgi:hypothetical protein
VLACHEAHHDDSSPFQDLMSAAMLRCTQHIILHDRAASDGIEHVTAPHLAWDPQHLAFCGALR